MKSYSYTHLHTPTPRPSKGDKLAIVVPGSPLSPKSDGSFGSPKNMGGLGEPWFTHLLVLSANCDLVAYIHIHPPVQLGSPKNQEIAEMLEHFGGDLDDISSSDEEQSLDPEEMALQVECTPDLCRAQFLA